MSRSRLFLKNTSWELGYYAIVVVLGFFAPRYIILTYGSDVNGLSSTITQILNVILLLQAGATTAAVYSLFKPIAENDIESISEKVTASNRYFKKLSCIFLAIMLCMAIVTAFSLNSEIPSQNIFIAFVAMGLKSFIDLYSTSKYRIVFSAYQEKYYISIATLIEQIVYYILVFATIFLQLNYLFLFFWLFIGCIAKVIMLRKIYADKHGDITTMKQSPSATIKGKNYSLANEISHSLITTSVAILISFLYGLKEASVFSIYTLIFSAIYLVSTALNSSFSPSFANLWAKGDEKRASEVFRIFQYLYVMMNTLFMMLTLFLIIPFVKIYTGGVDDVDYTNYTLAIIYCIQGLLSAYRIPYNLIVSSCGYFKETWIQPVITLVVSVILSLGLGRYDYSYILIGPTLFYFVNFMYQHYRLKKLCPILISKRVLLYLTASCIGLGMSYCIKMIVSEPTEIIGFVGYTVVTIVTFTILLLCISRLFFRDELIMSIDYIRSLIKKK